MIYLDFNATAPPKPKVIAEMAFVMEAGGNPSSVHTLGRRAKAKLENSRRTIGEGIACRPQKIIFTSGGTEANNIALKATGVSHIITSTTEHESIIQIAHKFAGTVDYLPVDDKGRIAPDDLEAALAKAPENTLVSIILANNETGVIQDIKHLAAITHDSGALFHTDAVQALGKIPLDFRDLSVDLMSLSAHKIGGPQGVGALVAREKIPINPLIAGGGQEMGRRSGTENLVGIAGFAKAVELIQENLDLMPQIQSLRDRIEQEIANFAPDARFFGEGAPRLPNTTTILMPGVASETQVMAFDLEGICVSSGAACSSGKVKPSHVVSAMGGSREEALSTIRVSLGWTTTAADVDLFVAAWKKIYSRKRHT